MNKEDKISRNMLLGFFLFLSFFGGQLLSKDFSMFMRQDEDCYKYFQPS